MSFKGAIFDLDGVIVNTIPLHYRAWKRMFSEYNRPFTMKEYEAKVDGIPRIDGAKAVLTGLDDAGIEKAAARKQKYFMEAVRNEGVEIYQTTVDLIKELRSHGIKIAVISSSKNCPDILKMIDFYPLIEAEVDGNMTQKGKPDPWIFLEAARRLKLEPSECVVFEDAVLGVQAGKRAGMYTIGIDRRYSPKRLGYADLVIHDLSELDHEKLSKRCA